MEQENQEQQQGEKKLTAGQKKALKEKQKKEEERLKKEAEAKAKGEKQENKDETENKDNKKAGKKPKNAAAAAAMKLQQLKQEEEERVRAEYDRKQKEEEERLRLIEEEIKAQEEQRLIKKKQKEDEKKKLIDSGQYLTPAQRKQKEKEDKAREQFLKMMGMTEDSLKQESVQQEVKSKAVKKTKKKKIEENFDTIQVEQNKIDEEKKEEEAVENWENLLDDNVEEPEQKEQKEKSRKVSIEQKIPSRKISTEQQIKKRKKSSFEDNPKSQFVNDSGIRSPIICILGHVDTGKTTLLDRIRNTSVQEGEAGGITQQIGATFFPGYKIRQEVNKLKEFYPVDIDVPGILVIDTPGHESFSNLRTRGSSLCDMAILVIDIMHGLEPQTLESIELLKMRKTPFVIALNKIDRLYEWKSVKYQSSYISLKDQQISIRHEFEKRYDEIMLALTEKGFNTSLYWDNQNIKKYVSIIPTSGITGEGIPDIFAVMLKYSMQFLKEKITLKDSFSCTVLEVKKIEGLGTTIDVILVDGMLREGDKICLLGFQGVIKTSIRALLTTHPMKEMRVKNEYLHFKEIKAAQGIKITAPDLEEAVAGSQLYVYRTEEEFQQYKKELECEIKEVRKRIKLSKEGVVVMASTLGSLEALLNFLKTSKIPVSYINVGNVSRDDVLQCLKSVSSENSKKNNQEYACVLAFDVKILPEAQYFADNNGIKIFNANIIYHLFDQFKAHVQQIRDERKLKEGKGANFPCILKPVAFFNKKDPIVMGVDVERGILRIGTPLVVYDKDRMINIGKVTSIEANHKSLQKARKSDGINVNIKGSVAIKIQGDTSIAAEKNFTLQDQFVSNLTRQSIDLLLEHFRDEMTNQDWDLVRELKPFFGILSKK